MADCARMALDESDLVKLALALVISVFFVALAIYAYRKGSRSFAEAQAQAQAQLAQRGYARQVLRREHGGRVTRLWGPLPEPTPIYLRVLNNDGVAVSVGDLLGVADLKVGHARFDGNFVVRSNFPEAARAVLDDAMQRRLMSHRNIDFSTGAVSNLLGVDHCAQQAGDCDLRRCGACAPTETSATPSASRWWCWRATWLRGCRRRQHAAVLRPRTTAWVRWKVCKAGATGRNRTCDVAFGGPHDIHFTTVACPAGHSSAAPPEGLGSHWRRSRGTRRLAIISGFCPWRTGQFARSDMSRASAQAVTPFRPHRGFHERFEP